ncbi:hypothetical protein GBAR_LOCUS1782, partial [Geodia barretti]
MSDEVDGGCELNLSATPEDAQSPHVSSLFWATVTGLKSRGGDGKMLIYSYIDSTVAAVKTRVGSLEVWVQEEIRHIWSIVDAIRGRLARVEERGDGTADARLTEVLTELALVRQQVQGLEQRVAAMEQQQLEGRAAMEQQQLEGR